MSIPKHCIGVLLIAGLLLATASVAHAQPEVILKLDVGNSTAVAELEPGYTAFTVADSGKIFNGVKVTFAGTLLSRRRGGPTGTGFDEMIRDFIFAEASNMTITLEGLSPMALYAVKMYAWDSSSGGVRNAVWTANGLPLLQTTFNGNAPPASWQDLWAVGHAVSNLQGQIVLQSAKGPNDAGPHWAFLNALILEEGDPCYNIAPYLQLDFYKSIDLAVEPFVQLNLTVYDDGRPFVGGCDPADPTGVPVGLSYDWTQVSGPAQAIIDDPAIPDPIISFTQKGVYQFKVSVVDGPLGSEDADGKESVATITVRVKDSAADDFLLAHWPMEENAGTVAHDHIGGYHAVFADSTAPDPNWVGGWIEGASPNSALRFWGVPDGVGKPLIVPDDPNFVAASDPNFVDLQYEITVAAWIKAEPFDTARTWDTIVSKGDHTWRIARNSGTNNLGFFCNRPGLATARAEGITSVNDRQWHHVAGTYDGQTIRLYVDGILDASGSAMGPFARTDAAIMIGGNSATGPGYRTWNGNIDDVRVYTYALGEDEIAALASQGVNLVPRINAGPDATFQMQEGQLTLNATLIDDGKPMPAAVSWSLVQASPPEAEVIFITEQTRLDPTISFTMAGSYLLQITADDGMAESSDRITITVTSPTCDDVIADGLGMLADFSGPEGKPDCKIDLYDLAVFALNWAKCNDPMIPECDWPY